MKRCNVNSVRSAECCCTEGLRRPARPRVEGSKLESQPVVSYLQPIPFSASYYSATSNSKVATVMDRLAVNQGGAHQNNPNVAVSIASLPTPPFSAVNMSTNESGPQQTVFHLPAQFVSNQAQAFNVDPMTLHPFTGWTTMPMVHASQLTQQQQQTHNQQHLPVAVMPQQLQFQLQMKQEPSAQQQQQQQPAAAQHGGHHNAAARPAHSNHQLHNNNNNNNRTNNKRENNSNVYDNYGNEGTPAAVALVAQQIHMQLQAQQQQQATTSTGYNNVNGGGPQQQQPLNNNGAAAPPTAPKKKRSKSSANTDPNREKKPDNKTFRAQWQLVAIFDSEEEMQRRRLMEKVSKRKTNDLKTGRKITYRCNSWRRLGCRYSMYAIFQTDNRIALYQRGEHIHALGRMVSRKRYMGNGATEISTGPDSGSTDGGSGSGGGGVSEPLPTQVPLPNMMHSSQTQQHMQQQLMPVSSIALVHPMVTSAPQLLQQQHT